MTSRRGSGGADLRASPETAQVTAIAELIADHRLRHRSMGDLPARLQPTSYEPVEAVMHAIHRRIPWSTAGWKVGAASTEVQRLERLPGPVPGRLYRHRVLHSGARLGPAVLMNHRNTECEFAFRLGEDLPARVENYTIDEVAAAVETMIPVVEIGDSVFSDWYSAAQYYGPCMDNGGGAALVLGTPDGRLARGRPRGPADRSVCERHPTQIWVGRGGDGASAGLLDLVGQLDFLLRYRSHGR